MAHFTTWRLLAHVDFQFADRSDTIPKAFRRRTRVITQEQLFTCAVGALDGQLEVDQEIAGLRAARVALRRLPSRLWGLFCSLIEPVFEKCLAQLRVIVRNQCPLAHRDPDVARVRVRDYLARILARSQVPPGEFIQAKLFRPPDFNHAVHG